MRTTRSSPSVRWCADVEHRLTEVPNRISYRDLQRLETFPIPREALSEAVRNGLIHKDYSSGTPIQIRVHRDKLRIWNSGQLPPTWTADQLHEPHDSPPPNPDIANTFFRAGLIEAWGREIRDACREAGSPEPSVEFDNGVRLSRRWQVPDRAEQPESWHRPPVTPQSTTPSPPYDGFWTLSVRLSETPSRVVEVAGTAATS